MSQLRSRQRLEISSWNLPSEVVDFYKRQGVERMFPWQVDSSYNSTVITLFYGY